MFVIIYQPTNQSVKLKREGRSISMVGKWIVDTGEDGQLVTEDDLATALSRVQDIRLKGGEAALATLIE
jgi:hypothetical protein